MMLLSQHPFAIIYVCLIAVSITLPAFSQETTSSGKHKSSLEQARFEWLNGNKALQCGKDREALEWFRQAVAHAPKEKQYTKSFVWVLEELGFRTESLAACKKAMVCWPDDVDLLDWSSSPPSSYKSLAKRLERKLQDDPTDSEAQSDLARCLLALHEPTAALPLAINAACQRPNDIAVRISMLSYLNELKQESKLGRKATALHDFEVQYARKAAENNRILYKLLILNFNSSSTERGNLADEYCHKFVGGPMIHVTASLTPRRKYSAQAIFALAPTAELRLQIERAYWSVHRNYKLAEIAAQKLIKGYPNNLAGYQGLSFAQFSLGNVERGERTLRLLTSRFPDRADIEFELACRLAAHDLDGAISAFERGVQGDHRNFEAFQAAFIIALAALKEKQFALSKAFTMRASRLLEDDFLTESCCCNLARQTNSQQILESVEKHWAERVLKQSDQPISLKQPLEYPNRDIETERQLMTDFLNCWRNRSLDICGVQHMADNRFAVAERIYEKLTKLDPHNPETYLSLSQALFNNGKKQGAIDASKQAAILAKQQKDYGKGSAAFAAGFYSTLVGMQMKMNLRGDAEQTVSRMVALGIKDKNATAAVLANSASQFVEKEQFDQALLAISEAIQNDSSHWGWYELRARLYLLKNQRTLAIADINRARVLGRQKLNLQIVERAAKLMKGELDDQETAILGRRSRTKHPKDEETHWRNACTIPQREQRIASAEKALALGQFDEAFNLAVALDGNTPNNERIIRIMAIAAQAKGDYHRASALRERLVRMTKNCRKRSMSN